MEDAKSTEFFDRDSDGSYDQVLVTWDLDEAHEGRVQVSMDYAGGYYDNINPVPIPSASWLLASGLIGMVGMRRKFRK